MSTRAPGAASWWPPALSTAFGKIAVGLSERQAETAFQAGLRGFSKLLVRVAAVLTTSIFVINVALHRPLLDALLFSLAIAIGITPQLLPAIVSVSLSTGSRELARRRVLVKRLVTIEDLGNIEVLFTDKTGTLTEGAITFDQALDPAGRPAAEPLLLGLVCNEATMTTNGPVGGNALDVALWSAPAAAALAADATGGPLAYQRLGLAPFDHDRQLASVAVRTSTGVTLLVVGRPRSGAGPLCRPPRRRPEVPPAAVRRRRAGRRRRHPRRARADHAGPGRRARPAPSRLPHLHRPTQSRRRPVDRQTNGLGVGRQSHHRRRPHRGRQGLRGHRPRPRAGPAPAPSSRRLDDDALAAAIPHTTVFARVSPDQKSRIIKVARRTGIDVAFLGDGVNDAVALHAADVGISVETAVDVAKEAADIVLLDQDLGVLAEGVMEGRRIFANTLKYMLMGTVSNFGNMFSTAGASLFLSFLPMLPIQILLNNLLYDTGQLADPHRPGRPRDARPTPPRGTSRLMRRFMSVFGPRQLNLRLPDLLRDAAGPARQPPPSSAAAGSSNPSPPRPWWCTSSAPGGSRSSTAAPACRC